jgi:hypothetical protein
MADREARDDDGGERERGEEEQRERGGEDEEFHDAGAGADPPNPEEEMRGRRNLGRTLREIDDLVAKFGVDVCLFENTDAGRAIWEEAVTGFEAERNYEFFRQVIPQGPVIARSVLEFAVASISEDDLGHQQLYYIFQDFFRILIIDYEVAWGFNSRLRLRFRGLDRIKADNFGGRGMIEKEYFASHQWHLNDNTYNRMCEELRAIGGDENMLRTLPDRFPHIPFKATWNRELQRCAHSVEAYNFHRLNKDLPPIGLPEIDTFSIFKRYGRARANHDWWYKGDVLRDIRAIGIGKDQKVAKQSTPEKGGASDKEWPPIGNPGSHSGLIKGYGGGPGKPLKSALKAGKGYGTTTENPRYPDGDPSSSSSSSATSGSDSDRKKKKKGRQPRDDPEEYKKRQYARGANYGDLGDTSLREPGKPVYSYVSGPKEKEGEFADRIRDRSIAKGVADERAIEIGTFLEGVRDIVKEEMGRSRTKEVTKERKRDASELRIGDYDVDYNGGSVEEILGRKFRTAAFRSDVERQMIAKDLLQLVMFSNEASVEAKRVAYEGLSKINTGAVLSQTMEMAASASRMGITTTLTTPEHDGVKEVPPPVFGTQVTVHSNVSKLLMGSIGGKKLYVRPKDGSKPVPHVLPTIANAITVNGLSAEAAFNIMLNITGGSLYDCIYSNQTNPDYDNCEDRFRHVWSFIQTITQRSANTAHYEAELRKKVMAKPDLKSLNDTLLDIKVYSEKCFEGIASDEERRTLIKEKAKSSLFCWVDTHFPETYPTIEGVYEDERQGDERNKKHAAIQGIPYIGKFNAVDSLITIILNYINKRQSLYQGSGYIRTGKAQAHLASASEMDKDSVASEKTTSGGKAKGGDPKDAKIKELQQTLAVMTARVQKIENPGAAHAQRQYQGGNGGFNGPLSCKLCNMEGHSTYRCRIYNERPGTIVCQNCGGKHVSPCKYKPRLGPNAGPNSGDRNSFPRGGNNYQRGNYQKGNPQSEKNNKNANQGQSSQGQRPEKMQMGQGLANEGRQPGPTGTQ